MSEVPEQDPTVGLADPDAGEPRPAGRLARSTAFFSFATGLSRIAGLVREIVAASYFGVKGPMSAFTIAFQVPNLVRSLFADQAIQAALVPIFTEDLERGRARDAFRLTSTLIFLFSLILGALVGLFILVAPLVMHVFAPGFEGHLYDLTVALSRLLFPILLMLGVSGLVVGILNSYERFAVFALAPLFWNIAIVAVLVGLAPAFPEGDQIYAYAIGVLVGTAVQLAILCWDLRHTPFRLQSVFEWRSPRVKRVLLLMLPVTISLGLINVNLVINSLVGTLVSDRAPAAIDKAFRIYMLPQGMFSVALTTVIYPTLSRFAARGALDDLRSTMANGMRQIVLLLLPAAAAILVLSEPMIQLVYQRGEFDASQTDLVATALFWFAFSLPFNGLFLLLTRTFFSLQRPWVPTSISALNLVITAGAAFALYGPFGVGGIVAATAIATAASVAAQAVVLRRLLGGLEITKLTSSTVRIAVASAILAGVSYGVWDVLDHALGSGLGGQIVSLGTGLLAGAAAYLGALAALRVPELEQILRLVRRG
ncbi:MAG TPA: murein biosynthesis integral membrane protein MurJ, partial [Solirubrobacterales bacterium]|nr:murein biosynthesis integral membrane protein MurJ [Solirubrobacterales bacterium]